MLAASGSARGGSLPIEPRGPLSSVGRWLVDATGRVVMIHGVNDVAKNPPY